MTCFINVGGGGLVAPGYLVVCHGGQTVADGRQQKTYIRQQCATLCPPPPNKWHKPWGDGCGGCLKHTHTHTHQSIMSEWPMPTLRMGPPLGTLSPLSLLPKSLPYGARTVRCSFAFAIPAQRSPFWRATSESEKKKSQRQRLRGKRFHHFFCVCFSLPSKLGCVGEGLATPTAAAADTADKDKSILFVCRLKIWFRAKKNGKIFAWLTHSFNLCIFKCFKKIFQCQCLWHLT